MRAPGVAALLLALLPSLAAASPLARLTDRSDILGWEAVGKIGLDGRGFCTASLIAPSLVLTAAHCLFDPETGQSLDPERVTFEAGLRDGQAIAAGRGARAVVHPRYDGTDPRAAESVRHDAALLELADPIPATTADPFPLAGAPVVGRRVTVLSYGRGRAAAMSRETGCSLIAAGNGFLAFDCQAEPGSSGAPIFDMGGRSPRIVSIVSGLGEYEGRPAVFGMELPRLMADLRRALRTGEGVWPASEPATRRVIGLSDRAAGTARFLRP